MLTLTIWLLVVLCWYVVSIWIVFMSALCHCCWVKCRLMLLQLAPGFCWNQCPSWDWNTEQDILHSTLLHLIYYQYLPPFLHHNNCCSFLDKMKFYHWIKSRVGRHFGWRSVVVIWHFPKAMASSLLSSPLLLFSSPANYRGNRWIHTRMSHTLFWQ